MERFTLDEDKAAGWLAQIIAQNDPEQGKEWDDSLPELTEDWRPVDDYSDGWTVSNLLSAARHAGLIEGPEGGAPEYDHSSDTEEAGYRWLVFLTLPSPGIILAGSFGKLRHLGDSRAQGAEAALSVLREAVTTANLLMDELDAFIAARQA